MTPTLALPAPAVGIEPAAATPTSLPAVSGDRTAATTADPNAGAPAGTAPVSPTIAAPSEAPQTGETPDAPPQDTSVPAWTRNLSIGGGATLYYYHSTDTEVSNFSVFNARIILDGKWDAFGFHLEPRVRDTKLRPFFDGPAWLQEAYGSFSVAPVTIKLGKVYKQSGGLFWDNSFYGNVQVYDGLKLDPNYGVSVEASLGKELGVDVAAQYFVVDGSTNVSLQSRDTISVSDAAGARARRKNTVAGRVSPFYKLAEASELRLGFTAEYFQAALPAGDASVSRIAGDAKFTYSLGDAGNFGIWGEYLHQAGRHVVDHPSPAGASGDNNYFLVGAEYNIWRLTARYNVSHADYRDVDVEEVLHVPALRFAFNEHLGLLGEYVIWRQKTPAADVDYDTSLNITLNGDY